MNKMLDEILVEINVDEKSIKNYSLISLAFLGDSIHSLFIREKLIEKGNFKVKLLHSTTTKFVKAKAQSFCLNQMLDILNEDEKRIVNSAKNSKTNNIAKNCTVEEYKSATAFECLLGYVALKKDFNRLHLLLNFSYDIINNVNNLN